MVFFFFGTVDIRNKLHFHFACRKYKPSGYCGGTSLGYARSRLVAGGGGVAASNGRLREERIGFVYVFMHRCETFIGVSGRGSVEMFIGSLKWGMRTAVVGFCFKIGVR